MDKFLQHSVMMTRIDVLYLFCFCFDSTKQEIQLTSQYFGISRFIILYRKMINCMHVTAYCIIFVEEKLPLKHVCRIIYEMYDDNMVSETIYQGWFKKIKNFKMNDTFAH